MSAQATEVPAVLRLPYRTKCQLACCAALELTAGRANDVQILAVGRKHGCGKNKVRLAHRLLREKPESFGRVQDGLVSLEKEYFRVFPAAQPRTTARAVTRRDSIRQLAAEGNSTPQIAVKLQLGLEYVRRCVRSHDIDVPADAHRGSNTSVRYARVVEHTVEALAGYAFGLSSIAADMSDITETLAADLLRSLNESLQPIHQLRKLLQGVADGTR